MLVQCLRMDEQTCLTLLSLVSPSIKKQDTRTYVTLPHGRPTGALCLPCEDLPARVSLACLNEVTPILLLFFSSVGDAQCNNVHCKLILRGVACAQPGLNYMLARQRQPVNFE